MKGLLTQGASSKSMPRSLFQNLLVLKLKERERVNIEVKYEWTLPTCKKCQCFGHVAAHCPAKEIWLPNTSVTATAETAASQNNDQDHTTEDTFVGGRAECFHAIVEEHTTLIL